MKLIKPISGKWQGLYTLGKEYEKNEGQSTNFILELIEGDEDTFTGICIEDVSEFFDEPITVEGFIEDNFISFTKKYPCLYLKDENNNFKIDPRYEHGDIYYSGEYDLEENKFQGEFELISDSFPYMEGWMEAIYRGSWTMFKID